MEQNSARVIQAIETTINNRVALSGEKKNFKIFESNGWQQIAEEAAKKFQIAFSSSFFKDFKSKFVKVGEEISTDFNRSLFSSNVVSKEFSKSLKQAVPKVQSELLPKIQNELLPIAQKLFAYYNIFSSASAIAQTQGMVIGTVGKTLGALNRTNLAFEYAQQTGQDLSPLLNVASLYNPFAAISDLSPSKAKQNAFMAASAFSEVEYQQTRVRTMLPREQWEENDRLIRNTTATLKNAVSTTEALALQYEVLSAGFTNAADAAKVTEAAVKLTKAGFADAADTARLLVSTMQAYEMTAGEAASTAAKLQGIVAQGITTIPELSRVFGQLSAVASQAGASIEDVGAALAVLTQKGQSTNVASTSIQSLLMSLINPSPGGEKALRRYSAMAGKVIDITPAAIRSKGLTETLIEIGQVTGFDAQKLSEIFTESQSYRAAVSLLADRGVKMKNVKESLGSKSATFLEEQFEISLGTQREQFVSFVNEAKALLEDVGKEIAPLFLDLIRNAREFFEIFKAFPDVVKKGLVGLLQFKLILGGIVEAAGTLLSGFTQLAKILISQQLMGLGVKFLKDRDRMIARFSEAQQQGRLLQTVLKELFNIDSAYSLLVNKLIGQGKSRAEAENLVKQAMQERKGDLTELLQKESALVELVNRRTSAIKRLNEVAQQSNVVANLANKANAADVRESVISRAYKLSKTESSVFDSLADLQTKQNRSDAKIARRKNLIEFLGNQQIEITKGLEAVLSEANFRPIKNIQNEMMRVREAIRTADEATIQSLNQRYQQLVQQYQAALNNALQKEIKPLNNVSSINIDENFLNQAKRLVDEDNKRVKKLMPIYKKRQEELKKNKEKLDQLDKALQDQNLTQKERMALERERSKAESQYAKSLNRFQEFQIYKDQSAETNALRKTLYMERLSSNIDRYKSELMDLEKLETLNETQRTRKEELERRLNRTERRLQQVVSEFVSPNQAIQRYQARIDEIDQKIKAGNYADPAELAKLEKQKQIAQRRIDYIQQSSQSSAEQAIRSVNAKPSALSAAAALDAAGVIGSVAYFTSSLPTIGKIAQLAQGKEANLEGGEIANLVMSSLLTAGTLKSFASNYSFDFLKPITGLFSSGLSWEQKFELGKLGVSKIAESAGRLSGVGVAAERWGNIASSLGFQGLGAGLTGLATNKLFLGAAGIAAPLALGFGAYKIWEHVGSELGKNWAKQDIVTKGQQAVSDIGENWDKFREQLNEVMDKNTEATQENTAATESLSTALMKMLTDGERYLPKRILKDLAPALEAAGVNPDNVNKMTDEEFNRYLGELERFSSGKLKGNALFGLIKLPQNLEGLVGALKTAENDPGKLLTLSNLFLNTMVKSGGYNSATVAQIDALKKQFEEIEAMGDPNNLATLLGPNNNKIMEKIQRGEALTAEETDIINQSRRKLSDSLEAFKAEIDAMGEQIQKELEQAIKNQDTEKIVYLNLMKAQLGDLSQRYGKLEPKYKEAQKFGQDQIEGYNQFARNIQLYGEAKGDATKAATMMVQQELKGYQEARDQIQKEVDEGKAKGNFMQALRNNITQEMDSIQQALNQGLLSYEEAVERIQKLRDYEIKVGDQKTKVFNPTEQLEIEAKLIDLQKTKIEQEREYLSLVQQVRDAIDRTEYSKQIEQLTTLNNYVTAVAESTNKLAESVKISAERLKSITNIPFASATNERLGVLASMMAQTQNLKKQESDINLALVNERKQAFEQTAQTNLQIMDKEKEIALLEAEYQKRNISAEQRKIIEARLMLLRQEKDLLELQNVSIENQYRMRKINLELQQESVKLQKQMLKEEAAISIELTNRNQQLAQLEYNRNMFQDTVQTVASRGDRFSQSKAQVVLADNDIKNLNKKMQIEMRVLELLKKQNDLALKRQEIETKILQTKLKQEKMDIELQMKVLRMKEDFSEVDQQKLDIYQSQIRSIEDQISELNSVLVNFADMRQQMELSFNVQRIGLEQSKLSEVYKALLQKEQAKVDQQVNAMMQKQGLLSSFYDNLSGTVSSYFRGETRFQQRRRQRVLANIESLKIENEASMQEKVLQLKEKELEITTKIKEIELQTAKMKLESEIKVLELKRQQAEQAGASQEQLQSYDATIESLGNQLSAYDDQILAVRELARTRREEIGIERAQNRINIGFRRMNVDLMLAQANEGRFSSTIRQFERDILARFGQYRSVQRGFGSRIDQLFGFTQEIEGLSGNRMNRPENFNRFLRRFNRKNNNESDADLFTNLGLQYSENRQNVSSYGGRDSFTGSQIHSIIQMANMQKPIVINNSPTARQEQLSALRSGIYSIIHLPNMDQPYVVREGANARAEQNAVLNYLAWGDGYKKPNQGRTVIDQNMFSFLNQQNQQLPITVNNQTNIADQAPQRLQQRQLNVNMPQTNKAVSNIEAVTNELKSIRKDMVENFSTVIKVLQKGFSATQTSQQQVVNPLTQLTESLRVLNGLKK